MWGLSTSDENGATAECQSCHREKGLGRPVGPGGHPVNLVAPRPLPDMFPLFGTSGEKAKNGVMTCATCHEVHGLGVLAAGEGTGMLLRARGGSAAEDIGRIRACLPCHQGKEATHGQADCIWCHPPHKQGNTGPDCRACHAMGGNGTARMHGDKLQGCGTCHRIHSARDDARAAGVCLDCHPKHGRVVGTFLRLFG